MSYELLQSGGNSGGDSSNSLGGYTFEGSSSTLLPHIPSLSSPEIDRFTDVCVPSTGNQFIPDSYDNRWQSYISNASANNISRVDFTNPAPDLSSTVRWNRTIADVYAETLAAEPVWQVGITPAFGTGTLVERSDGTLKVLIITHNQGSNGNCVLHELNWDTGVTENRFYLGAQVTKAPYTIGWLADNEILLYRPGQGTAALSSYNPLDGTFTSPSNTTLNYSYPGISSTRNFPENSIIIDRNLNYVGDGSQNLNVDDYTRHTWRHVDATGKIKILETKHVPARPTHRQGTYNQAIDAYDFYGYAYKGANSLRVNRDIILLWSTSSYSQSQFTSNSFARFKIISAKDLGKFVRACLKVQLGYTLPEA